MTKLINRGESTSCVKIYPIASFGDMQSGSSSYVER